MIPLSLLSMMQMQQQISLASVRLHYTVSASTEQVPDGAALTQTK